MHSMCYDKRVVDDQLFTIHAYIVTCGGEGRPWCLQMLHLVAKPAKVASNSISLCVLACWYRYATHVHEALTGLVADPDQEVRRLMALQFHDICKMLGKERCAQYMKRCPHLPPTPAAPPEFTLCSSTCW